MSVLSPILASTRTIIVIRKVYPVIVVLCTVLLPICLVVAGSNIATTACHCRLEPFMMAITVTMAH